MSSTFTLSSRERELSREAEKYRVIFENANDALFLLDNKIIIDCNRKACELFGYTHKEELIGKNPFNVSPQDGPGGDVLKAKAEEIMDQATRGISQFFDWDHVRADGSIMNAEISASRIMFDNKMLLLAIVRDRSEHEAIEKTLRENEQRFKTIIEEAPFGAHMYTLYPGGRLVFTGANRSADRILGVEHSQFIGKTIEDAFPALIDTDIPDAYRRVAEKGALFEKDQSYYNEQGISGSFELHAFNVGPGQMTVFFIDITERKKADEVLRCREEEYRRLVETANEGIWVLDKNYTTIFVNHKMADVLGYEIDEMMGKPLTNFLPEEELEDNRKQVMERHHGKKGNYDRKFIRKDGIPCWMAVSATPLMDEQKDFYGSFAMLNDISLRKKAEFDLRRSEERYRMLIETSPDGITFIDLSGHILLANTQAARLHGDENPDDIVGLNIFDLMESSDRSRAEGNFHDLFEHVVMKGVEYMFLCKDGTRFPGELSVSLIRDNNREPLGFIAITRDITERKRDREKLQESFTRLGQTTDGIIASISHLVELRDPYTAGHQRHVSQLAQAIAREMGLPEDRVNGIRIAGLIHDLGKIYVPAEILSKPGVLNTIEFEMIKVHPQAGYDILRSIDFSWPVAEVAHQHQERLDGSGYPRGLKGEEILLEARIVSVADTVEAMSFRRPYRPIVGLDKALAEIEKNKGRLFDSGVVDTCLYLFHSKKFVFDA